MVSSKKFIRVCRPAWLRYTLVALVVLSRSRSAFANEHPGILDRQDTCSTCHADKFQGKFVHSAMTLPCTVCHVAQTKGDMTTIDLLMPKEKICFACHAKSSESAEHNPPVKGDCIRCHDSHASNRRMLLRQQAGSHISMPMPSSKRTATSKARN